ncbi:hypothetical protein WJX81_006737 [Elliptochloris bilobata]|uniref:Uncharacterized protein n=1 Tax=Elliptochloris bilobata TaxID=381761 RepID=A0AAW1QXB7_9CHLO
MRDVMHFWAVAVLLMPLALAQGPAVAPAELRLPSAPAPAPGSPAVDGCKKTAELLFVQTADQAELIAAPGGALTLVLRNVSRITTYFTDKPERRAGSIYTQSFSTDRSFYVGKNTSNEWLGRPNAALYGLRGEPTAEGGETRNNTVFIVTLFTPKYDAAAQTLTYPVKVIPDNDPKNESIVAWYRRYKSEANVPLVRKLAEDKWPRLVLHDVALFIDDWSSFENSAFCDDCCAVSCYMNHGGSMWGLGGGFW